MIFQGDCLSVLKTLDDNSIDSIVTDPPYGLSFMGKKWDYDVPSIEIWRECLRVLKPGGHLLSFAGTRTYHRMAVNIEDAGFEIRDQIMWLYGSGFPKSHNLKDEWQGWGTALKPANEPIVVARKPLEKGLTVAENVLKYGTGALNVDGSRIGTDRVESGRGGPNKTDSLYRDGLAPQVERSFVTGRWPANVLLDEEAAQALDEQSGTLKSGSRNGVKKPHNNFGTFQYKEHDTGKTFEQSSGGASRFFYVAKASKRERGIDNNHPTVKPVKLMEYLIKLVTPPNGTVLDPFMGSGTTGIASKNMIVNFVGIERDNEYFEIAKKRIGIESDDSIDLL